MRGLMAAVGKALAAVAMLVTVWVESLGRFVLRCLPGYQLPDPVDIVEAYDEAAAATDVTPKADERIAKIQAMAEAAFRQQPVTPEMIEGLSPKTLRWLELLDADMAIAVAKAKPAELADHLGLRKSIRGVLRYEDDAMEEYRKAVEADAKVPKRPSRRRTPEGSFALPAFGPIC